MGSLVKNIVREGHKKRTGEIESNCPRITIERKSARILSGKLYALTTLFKNTYV